MLFLKFPILLHVVLLRYHYFMSENIFVLLKYQIYNQKGNYNLLDEIVEFGGKEAVLEKGVF